MDDILTWLAACGIALGVMLFLGWLD